MNLKLNVLSICYQSLLFFAGFNQKVDARCMQKKQMNWFNLMGGVIKNKQIWLA